MKKDLQDRAVSNEREYFEDRILKRKLDLKPVIDWIKPSFQADPTLNPFTSFSQGTPSLYYSNISLHKFIIPIIINPISSNLSLRCSSTEQLPQRLPGSNLRTTLSSLVSRIRNVA